MNIPIGLVALWLSRRFLPDNPVRVSARRFDWRDAVMNALTFGLLMASVEGFFARLDPRLLTLGIAALLIVGFFFIRSQLREPYPILPFDLLRIPIFSVSVVTSICSFLGQMLAMVALPFYLQHEFGYDEVATGLLMTAWPAVIMVVAPVAGMLIERIHAGLLGGTGLTAMAAGLFLLVFLPEHPAPGDIVWRLVLCGAGFGLFPVAQQQHPDRLGSAREERKRQRHARHGASHRPDHGCGPDGAAVPHRPRRQHPHSTPARRRVRTHRSRRQPYPYPATPARRVGPAQEIIPRAGGTTDTRQVSAPPMQPGTARTANTQDNHTNNSIQQH